MNFETEILQNKNKWLNKAKQYYPNDIFSAEDLVSELILRLITNKDKFIIGSNFNAWSFFILKNLFINEYRIRKSRPVEVLLESDWCANLQSRNADTDILKRDILELVEKLPEALKTSFKLYLQEFKYEEIAEQLKIPVGTVKSRIFHSRKFLKKQLGYEYNK